MPGLDSPEPTFYRFEITRTITIAREVEIVSTKTWDEVRDDLWEKAYRAGGNLLAEIRPEPGAEIIESNFTVRQSSL